MSESYIASSEISVYPSSRRGVEYPESRLVTETALAGIVNKLIDKEGFVISNNTVNDFEFNIYGYYFKVNQCSYITDLFPNPESNTVIYGVITLTEVSDNIIELSGQDGAGEGDVPRVYKGIGFTTTQPNSDAFTKYLALLRYSSGTWSIVPESKFKFSASSSESLNIDGGII